jgi:hypothetical protein
MKSYSEVLLRPRSSTAIASLVVQFSFFMPVCWHWKVPARRLVPEERSKPRPCYYNEVSETDFEAFQQEGAPRRDARQNERESVL